MDSENESLVLDDHFDHSDHSLGADYAPASTTGFEPSQHALAAAVGPATLEPAAFSGAAESTLPTGHQGTLDSAGTVLVSRARRATILPRSGSILGSSVATLVVGEGGGVNDGEPGGVEGGVISGVGTLGGAGVADGAAGVDSGMLIKKHRTGKKRYTTYDLDDKAERRAAYEALRVRNQTVQKVCRQITATVPGAIAFWGLIPPVGLGSQLISFTRNVFTFLTQAAPILNNGIAQTFLRDLVENAKEPEILEGNVFGWKLPETVTLQYIGQWVKDIVFNQIRSACRRLGRLLHSTCSF